MLFAGFVWIFQFSMLFTIAFDLMIFLGYNDMFNEGYTFGVIDKYNFETLVMMQFLSYACGLFLKDSLIRQDTKWLQPVV